MVVNWYRRNVGTPYEASLMLRLFLSPLYEPRHHSLDPLLTREIELTGAYMRTVLEEQGKIAIRRSYENDR